MDESRKRAYLFLIYRCFIDIRMAPCHRVQWWNPRTWQSVLHENRRAVVLANAFHNLALYASREMNGFQEEEFWNGIERYAEAYPREAEFTNYKRLFEEKLADPHKMW